MRRWLLIAGLALGCGRTAPYDDPLQVIAPTLKACPTGGLSGRLCAPDMQTFINDALISVDAVDCNGTALHVETSTGADGSYELDGVPVGTWTVHAVSGAFTQDTPELFTAGQINHVPDGGLCVAQRDVKIAVVTGTGDKIETLLDSLGLYATQFSGDSGDWSSHGAPFLSDLSQMEQYDLIFIDCAAAFSSGAGVDFGGTAAQIESNLHAYVENGGSIYASDWGLVFAVYAAPGTFDVLTPTTDPIASPLDTTRLQGYAPQVVNATVSHAGLAAFLGKASVSISFPKQIGVSSSHWGLMESVTGADVLVEADGVETCGDSNCQLIGPSRDAVPLAVRLKLTPADQPGGDVVYTSFHNIDQPGQDVAQMLKYLVLHL